MLFEEDSDIMLHEADFPSYYKNKKHPDDYKNFSQPVQELIWNDNLGHNNRLLLRQSIKISDINYIPITFVCNTGATGLIYFNELSSLIFKDRIKYDDFGTAYLIINDKNFPIRKTQEPHQDCNVIGIKALGKFELWMRDREFGFNNLPEYF